jgi:hypothetical protein
LIELTFVLSLLTCSKAVMAYNGYNGFHDDVMDGVETSGPKVTVREVSLNILSH